MLIFGIAVLGAIVGASFFSGFGSGLWIGATIGALCGWCLKLQRRIDALTDRPLAHREPARQQPLGTTRVVVASDSSPTAATGPAGPSPVAADLSSHSGPAQGDPRNRGAVAAPPKADPWSDDAEPTAAAAATSTRTPASQTARPTAPPPNIPPGFVERLFGAAKEWFTTGNLPVKVGVILSVFGVGFLIKEGMDRGWLVLPISLRLVAVALFGVALLLVGWRLRKSKPEFALSVQGGGVAVLYLTIYAAFGIYSLLPASLAFLLLVIITVAAGTLAVLQDSRALAILGIVGGFMAPVLASTGSGNHVLLFSYYAVLNCAVFAIAWLKTWRVLNVLGFLFTFVIASLWGYQAYEPAQFASTEPFLILFVLMYILIPVLFARQGPPELRGFVDGTLVFGTPIVGFGLQTQLIGDSEYGLAISAVGLAAIYISLATFLFRKYGHELKVLGDAFFGLAVVFVTLAVPLALDARWTSVAWALQGAAMVWLGWRQRRVLALAAGVILQGLAAAAYLQQDRIWLDTLPVLNGYYIGAVLIAISAWFSSRVFDSAQADADRRIPHGFAAQSFLIWGTLWWLAAGLIEIERIAPSRLVWSIALIFIALTVALALYAGRWLAWSRIKGLGALLIPVLPLGLVPFLFESHPLGDLGWLAWPILFGASMMFLKTSENEFKRIATILHPLGYWVLTAVVAFEVYWQVDRQTSGVWADAASLAVVSAFILATLRWREVVRWPIAAHERSYVIWGVGGVLAALGMAMFGLNLDSPGNADPLPYMPIINPLELASLFVVLVALRWYAAANEWIAFEDFLPRYRVVFPVLVALFLLTMTVGRSVHHFAGVPFDLDQLAAADIFQAALSIVWGSTALMGMIFGARRSNRGVWIGGALLMGVVVVKLFVVELDNSGTVERVVSFLGVGLLLLIVGYFAPVPPRLDSADDPEPVEQSS